MPSTLPGISAAQAADMLETDKLIMTVPEVARVFGKTGKAETATRRWRWWRPPFSQAAGSMATGDDHGKIVEELDKTVRLPGLANLWVPPIQPHRHALHRHQEPDWH